MDFSIDDESMGSLRDARISANNASFLKAIGVTANEEGGR